MNMKKHRSAVKRKIFRRAACGILCATLLIVVIPQTELPAEATTVAEDQAALQKLEDELAQISATRKEAAQSYQAALSAYNNAKAEEEAALNVKYLLDKEVEALTQEIAQTNALLEEYNAQLETYAVEISEKEADIDKKYEALKTRMRLSYEESFVSYLELIMDSESFSDLLSRVDIVASMMDYDTRILHELEEARKELLELQQHETELKYKAEEHLSELKKQVPILEDKIEESAELLETLAVKVKEAQDVSKMTEAEKAAWDQKQAAMEKKIAEMEAEIEKKIKAAQAQNQAQYVGGEFMWPVNLQYSKITSYFGLRSDPFSGAQEHHGAIDIPAGYGTPVYAANDGKVIVAESHWSYGNYVVIDHGGGISTLYAHNSALLVSVGQTVTKGQQIAQIGSTGSSSGNHCHFEVRVSGKKVDPLGYVVQP